MELGDESILRAALIQKFVEATLYISVTSMAACTGHDDPGSVAIFHDVTDRVHTLVG